MKSKLYEIMNFISCVQIQKKEKHTQKRRCKLATCMYAKYSDSELKTNLKHIVLVCLKKICKNITSLTFTIIFRRI